MSSGRRTITVRKWGVVTSLWLLASAGLLRGADEPQIRCELSQQRVYAGESLRYHVTMEGADLSVEPKLEGFDDFDVRMLSRTFQSITATEFIDGRLRTVDRSGPMIDYLLTPKRSGNLTVPGPKVTVDGKEYVGPSLALEVLDPAKQDLVVMELTASRSEVYPLQPFTLRLVVAVKHLPEPYGDRDPVSVLHQRVPQLVLPWADDENLPPGVKPREPAGKWLSDYVTASRNESGFGINNIRTAGGFPDIDDLMSQRGFPDAQSMLSMFMEERRASFRGAPERKRRRDLSGATVEYWEFPFERVLMAEKLGSVEFSPATLKGMFAARADTRGNLELEPVYALTPPVSVLVKDAPTEGRPETYVGAIGRFNAGAQLAPTEVKVGDPMTLELWMQGTGTLADIVPPKLASDPRVTEAFKIYEATDTTEGNKRKFTFRLRPRRAGSQEFPDIPLTYFDYGQEKYVTLRTNPIPLEVAQANQLSESDIAMAEIPSSDHSPREINQAGIFANMTNPAELRDVRVQPTRWFLALATMASSFLIVALLKQQVEKHRTDVIGQRRRQAVKRALSRLDALPVDSATPVAARAIGDSISNALTGLIADAVGREEQGLTSSDLVRHLENLELDPPIVSRLASLLESCDAARYGARQQSLDDLRQQGRAVCEELAAALRHRKLVS